MSRDHISKSFDREFPKVHPLGEVFGASHTVLWKGFSGKLLLVGGLIVGLAVGSVIGEQPSGMIGPPISTVTGRSLADGSPSAGANLEPIATTASRPSLLNADLQASIPLSDHSDHFPPQSGTAVGELEMFESRPVFAGASLVEEIQPEVLKLLVLTDGRVVRGEISSHQAGYQINFGNGTGSVPKELVLTAATSLADAYQRISENRNNPTAAQRVQLAEWCLSQELLDEARQEVVAALRLDPNGREARALLQRIERAANPLPVESLPTPTHHAAEFTAEGYKSSAPLSTANLSPAAVQLYMRQVQPILVQRCATGGCHGPQSDSVFTLAPLRTRKDSEENLARVLSLVDAESAERTRLLMAISPPTLPHKEVLLGRIGEQQRVALAQWLSRVIEEQSNRESAGQGQLVDSPSLSAPHKPTHTWQHPTATPFSPKVNSITQVAHSMAAADRMATTPFKQPASGATPYHVPSIAEQPRPIPAQQSLSTGQRRPSYGQSESSPERPEIDEEFLRDILAGNQHDPFDPEEFNRKVHGSK
ncbi:MAG: hypothetical protein R3C01_07005 [Planctomycetaceae bacterium]